MDWQGWLDVAVSYLPPLPAVPQPPWWLSWLAGTASISTTILLRKLRIAGWYVMIANQFNWGWLAMAAGQHGLIASTLFYLYLGVAGLVAWTKDKPVKSSERNENTSGRADENPCCLHACGMRGGAASAEDPEEDTGATIYKFKPRA